MKKTILTLAAAAALSTMAAEIAVSPLQANGFKNPVIKENTVSGVSMPGCSIDFPHKGSIDGTGITQAKLVVENQPGGAEMLASDYNLNLRKDNKKAQMEVYGAPGRNPGEVYFMLKNVPDQINMVRLYPDKRRRFLGKELNFSIKSLTLDKAENGSVFLELINTRIGNCEVKAAFPTFTVKPQNTGSSIIIYPPQYQQGIQFSKIELGLTVLSGELDPAAMEANPRLKNKGVSAYKPQVEGNKYTFTLKEPFASADVFVFYLNRQNKLTGKELRFKIDYLCLIP